MRNCYWDSSALLALIFDERDSPGLEHFAKGGALPGWTSFFSLIEMESAFSRRITDRTLLSDILPEARLKEQRVRGSLSIVWPDEETVDEAHRFVIELGLRSGDALQLASARAVIRQEGPVAFAALDRRLRQAAEAIGLACAFA